MDNINREDLHIISQHSNLAKNSAQNLLQKNIYASADAWRKFFQLFFLSVGVGFTVAGIIFFFAYNWADLNKFVKLGLIGSLITLLTLVVVFVKFSPVVKNIILTGTSVLVGVLFAVFGQIYQTGANAYDFFLGWTVFVTLWVIAANFAPLWLIYILLINTTLWFYSEQVASDWTTDLVYTIFFVLNTAFVLLFLILSDRRTENRFPAWFLNCLALMAIFSSTIAVTVGMYHNYSAISYSILLVATAAIYALGIYYGFKRRNSFWLAIIPFSVIIIICGLLFKVADAFAMILFVAIFITGSVTLLIKQLIGINRRWTNHE